MKKLSIKQKIHHIHKSKHKIRRIWKSRQKSAKILPKINHRIVVHAPEILSLINENDRRLLLAFLRQIKDAVRNELKVHVLFGKTKRLHPCGMLLVLANIEALLDLHPKSISCNYPADDIVEQLFQHIGLLALLGKHTPRKAITAENVRYWHYIKGISTDDVSKFKNLLHSINFNEEIQSGLFESLSEAVTNTIQHAYKNSEQKMWWLFAQKKGDFFEIAVCDLGIGIPQSLRKKPAFKEFVDKPLQHYRNRKDTYLLQVAVGSSRSSTKLPHRGNGLKDMLEFAKTHELGGFRIFSAKGGFSYNSSNSEESRKDYLTDINGTIVQWHISLDSRHEE
ncbi:hypothetical protein KFZ76_20165 [Methylovulum psychrotolerans]|uniref:ATP-binding protein n=1 Tax=Methylovulum psychrotolerans TaxID=1704499 RepID=UPI001BFF9325|nr:hypothetical protein [Methylovulum psychrotolerans]MBT9100020.1 hypothetical protein [Methylovulum psychrotolerans]